MITVEAARARILAGLGRTGVESVPLGQGLGRVLAAPVRARLAQPPADVAAMDGYALRGVDGVAGARLRVIGAAPAGHPFAGVVGPGEAVRLFTGSFVPAGADTVLIQENATAADGCITVNEACTPGRHIRRAGSDFALGEVLIEAGRRLSARDIALAAAANHPWLGVYRRPRIAVLATGDELSLPGEAVGPGGIVNCNGPGLAAFVTACGGEPLLLPVAGDSLAAMAEAAAAARGADMLLTIGGASVGDYDLVAPGLAAQGFVLDFWKISMRPGKPLMFGAMGGMPVLGLPGNPVSAFVCARLFLRSAVEFMGGLPGADPVLEPAVLGAALKANDSREDFLRAALARQGGVWVAAPFAVQDSSMLKVLARADALIHRPAGQGALAAGDAVEILRLDDA